MRHPVNRLRLSSLALTLQNCSCTIYIQCGRQYHRNPALAPLDCSKTLLKFSTTNLKLGLTNRKMNSETVAPHSIPNVSRDGSSHVRECNFNCFCEWKDVCCSWIITIVIRVRIYFRISSNYRMLLVIMSVWLVFPRLNGRDLGVFTCK